MPLVSHPSMKIQGSQQAAAETLLLLAAHPPSPAVLTLPFPFFWVEGFDLIPPKGSGSPETGNVLPGQWGKVSVSSKDWAFAQGVDCFPAD